jgi:hypothetical protein
MLTLLLPLVTLASTTWTVDINGGGDFTQIADAVSQVVAGDVLLVEPGTYQPFTLTKRLTILGRTGGPRPHVTGDVQLRASTFTVAGFDMDLLHVRGVTGRGRIDDCTVRVIDDLEPEAALTVQDSDQLVISRTVVFGETDYHGGNYPAGTGISIRSSRVMLVQCVAWGGSGDDQLPLSGIPFPGGAGLEITNGSDVVLAGTSVYGGAGGSPFGFHPGAPGGPAVSVTGSTVRVRGDPTDKLAGGIPGINADTYGTSITASNSVVVSSGLQYSGSGFATATSLFLQPSVAEPFLSVNGNATAGATCSIELHGPPSTPAFLAASIAPALVTLPAFEGQLWLDPAALLVLIPIGTTGQDTPVILSANMPRSIAGFEGACFELQAFFPTVPGALDPAKKFAGNVAELILRF